MDLCSYLVHSFNITLWYIKFTETMILIVVHLQLWTLHYKELVACQSCYNNSVNIQLRLKKKLVNFFCLFSCAWLWTRRLFAGLKAITGESEQRSSKSLCGVYVRVLGVINQLSSSSSSTELWLLLGEVPEHWLAGRSFTGRGEYRSRTKLTQEESTSWLLRHSLLRSSKAAGRFSVPCHSW